jgi:hypothetical protein
LECEKIPTAEGYAFFFRNFVCVLPSEPITGVTRLWWLTGKKGGRVMKHLGVAVLLLAIPVLGVAQGIHSVIADLPFSFYVGKTLLPAGKYQFTHSTNMSQIAIAAVAGKEKIEAPILTRLSARSDDNGSVVFDVVGADHYLSEIYLLPGEDGFQLQGSANAHSHVNIKTAK